MAYQEFTATNGEYKVLAEFLGTELFELPLHVYDETMLVYYEPEREVRIV